MLASFQIAPTRDANRLDNKRNQSQRVEPLLKQRFSDAPFRTAVAPQRCESGFYEGPERGMANLSANESLTLIRPLTIPACAVSMRPVHTIPL